MNKIKSEREFLRLQKELEKKLGWGPVNQWHSSMFDELSNAIFEDSTIMLSPTTLKRFFGVVQHQGAPSITTLDTLAAYVGHKNWRDFKLYKKSNVYNFLNHFSNRSLYISIGFILAMATIMLIANKRLEPEEIPKEISFSSTALANTYPNSVVFNFDLKGVRSDSVYIQQYWDPDKTIHINKDQTQATGIYYFPGYFRAKLMVDGTAVKEHDLFLKSEGWIGSVEYDPVPKYFKPERIKKNGLKYPSSLIPEIKNSEEPLLSVFHYINDLGNISGDDFQLEANLKNTYSEKWAICQSTRIYILGSKGAMIFPFSILGCSSENNLMLNDIYRNGKAHDLSAFATDLKESTNIRVSVKNKTASIFINGREIYSETYKQSMGSIVGLRFKFLGMGEVESFSLKDQYENEIVF